MPTAGGGFGTIRKGRLRQQSTLGQPTRSSSTADGRHLSEHSDAIHEGGLAELPTFQGRKSRRERSDSIVNTRSAQDNFCEG